MNPARGPLMGWRGAHGAGPDEHHVGHRPEQAHDELIRVEEAADFAPARALIGLEGDHAIEGRDEVGDQRRPIGSQGHDQVAVVGRRELSRQVITAGRPAGRSAGFGTLFPESLEADRAAGGGRDRHRQEPPPRRPLTS